MFVLYLITQNNPLSDENLSLLRICEFLIAMRDVPNGLFHCGHFIRLLLGDDTIPEFSFLQFIKMNKLSFAEFRNIKVSNRLLETLCYHNYFLFEEKEQITGLIRRLFFRSVV